MNGFLPEFPQNVALLLTITDIVGTIAFAASGALLAIRKKMDIFGVNILGVITATGGGIIRDFLVGMTPPACFRSRRDVYIALITANILFVFFYFHRRQSSKRVIKITERIYFWFDTLGLAAFTVNGVAIGYKYPYFASFYLVVVLGMLTGVGGGVLRDVMAMEMPAIFVRNIYACASLLGAIVTAYLWNITDANAALLAGFLITILVRCIAAHYDLNLPNIHSAEQD